MLIAPYICLFSYILTLKLGLSKQNKQNDIQKLSREVADDAPTN